MSTQKIHIIGGPGSGKTYIASKLAIMDDITAYDLDQVFWDQSQATYVRASQEVRSAKLNEILAQSSWVIEGVYYKWLAPSFEDADVIIVLTTPLWKRQWRISKRFITRKFFQGQYHKETLKSFIELWKWNRDFDRDNLARIKTFIAHHQHKVRYCDSLEQVKRELR